MENPRMLFKVPGPHKTHEGAYDYTIVDETKVDETLKDGWFKTLPEAIEAAKPAEEPGKVEAAKPPKR